MKLKVSLKQMFRTQTTASRWNNFHISLSFLSLFVLDKSKRNEVARVIILMFWNVQIGFEVATCWSLFNNCIHQTKNAWSLKNMFESGWHKTLWAQNVQGLNKNFTQENKQWSYQDVHKMNKLHDAVLKHTQAQVS